MLVCSSIFAVFIEDTDYFKNYNWEEIKTLICLEEFAQLLRDSEYPEDKARYLIEGFSQGFSTGYRDPENRTDTAPNLPLNNLGTKTDLWNKVMKEVKAERYAGPYKKQDLPFQNYIQLPIGLVPKAGNQTRLIFHLSCDFEDGNESVSAHTLHELCTVKYKDLDHAIDTCIRLINKSGRNTKCVLFFSKADLKSAFRVIPVLLIHRRWLLLMAQDP